MNKIKEYFSRFSVDGFPWPFHWFHVYWWSYLFSEDVFTREDTHWWTIVLCRARNHPHKRDVSTSMDGLEPYYNCSNCGEDFS